MKQLIPFFMIMFLLSIAAAEPVVIIKNGYNKTLANDLIAAVPPPYLQGVDQVTFTNRTHPLGYLAYFSYTYNTQTGKVISTEMTFYSGSQRNINCIFLHELGHKIELENNNWTHLKLSENYANDYMQSKISWCKRYRE